MARNKAWKIIMQMEMAGLIRWYYPPLTLAEVMEEPYFRGTGVYLPGLMEYWRWMKNLEGLKR